MLDLFYYYVLIVLGGVLCLRFNVGGCLIVCFMLALCLCCVFGLLVAIVV